MPLYDYRCPECAEIIELFGRANEEPRGCPECGAKMKRLITTNYHVHGDMEPHLDYEMSSKPVKIKSRKHREQMMKEHGVQERIGKGWL